ncbi:hypothetical protein [Proteiniphilum sp.]|uniref:hypothetical protein n=1 Tax=Proteiniphilum sp. TaxID=1926877 RepID=UPI0033296EE6
MEENKQIELRSEKVRNIIGQVPPVLLRYGITIIGLSILMVVGMSAFIPYRPAIEMKVEVRQDSSGRLEFTGFIPQNAMLKKADFRDVSIYSALDFSLPERLALGEISDRVLLSTEGAWHLSTLIPEKDASHNIILEKPVTIPAKINLREMSVLKWVIRAM